MRNSPIPWLIFKFLFISLNTLFVSSQCLNNQRSLLIQLKNTLLFNSALSTKLLDWKTTKTLDCCHWPGVACDVVGHITRLDLSSESIQGGIENSTTISSKLIFLETLNLANNTFSNIEIPPDFGNLTSLKTLNLSNSGFTGRIPKELSLLINLERLDLSTLYFPGMPSLVLQNHDFSTLVRNLTKLTELRLDGVNISSSDWCGVVSSSLYNLKILSLVGCYLSGPLDSSLENLRNISEIYLDSNELSVHLPEFFDSFFNLRVLSLSSCNLSGTFPTKIFRLPELRVLDLENNGLLTGSLPEFGQNVLFEELVLTGTNFSGTVPYSIGKLKSLSRLDLSHCRFSGPIPKSISNLTRLVHLNLGFNHFTGKVNFLQMENLIYLDLSYNLLVDSVPSTHFESLTKLRHVDLSSNYLTGSFPSTLFTLPLLQIILLQNNHFSSEIIVPKNDSSLQLRTLDISNNNLQGHIPHFIFRFPKLNVLSLGFNNFSGDLELNVIQNLENLASLDLSNNKLSMCSNDNGTRPSIFPQLTLLKLASCNLKKFPALMNQSDIRTLDLSDNQITGKIPNWIWNGSISYLNLSYNFLEDFEIPFSLRHLSVIDVHFNQLKGEIPIPHTLAVYVDYSNNYFDSIPADIGKNLLFASYFSVSNNYLIGPIPQSICSDFNLIVLDLSNNQFNGSIPSCLIENMTETLSVFNLGNNHLTGIMNGNFPQSCALVTLELNSNRFKGKVPKSLANCKKLEVLNLRNNQINDEFPCFLRASCYLRVLVLSINKFQGDILCANENNFITWPQLQIIDLARNNFRGEIPSDLFLRLEAMMSNVKGLDHISFQIFKLLQFYYQDTVTVTNKGLVMELVKILTVYTLIDFSSNGFEGHIPEEVGNLKSLHSLNLSDNALTSKIPNSIGDLKEIESLDLSRNNLSGEIPNQLRQLSFLAVLNLSYNLLVGKIPSGSQFNTFSGDSYEGNPNLCGLPLNKTCIDSTLMVQSPTPSYKNPDSYTWEFYSSTITTIFV